MEDLIENTDGLSDENIQAAIRYLDPERNCDGGDGLSFVPVIACFAFWFIFCVGLYAFAIPAGSADSEALPE